jgi:hypothetical protein
VLLGTSQAPWRPRSAPTKRSSLARVLVTTHWCPWRDSNSLVATNITTPRDARRGLI